MLTVVKERSLMKGLFQKQKKTIVFEVKHDLKKKLIFLEQIFKNLWSLKKFRY